ncbi:MAG: hypothetical protein HQL76_01895 [Magnetococcales bacterium]|nr:hypothetical protein [Magnetococcales bacterium]
MMVVVIIGILGLLSLPNLRPYILRGNLQSALPYLMEISAKERSFYQMNGSYYLSPNNDEQDLEDTLGVDLSGAGDFCFLVRVGDGNYISSSGDSASGEEGRAKFEVWALLRDDSYSGLTPENDSVTSFNMAGVSCITADEKIHATGFVGVDGGDVGGEGRILSLRYPQPAFGLDPAKRAGRSTDLHWENGVTFHDALF